MESTEALKAVKQRNNGGKLLVFYITIINKMSHSICCWLIEKILARIVIWSFIVDSCTKNKINDRARTTSNLKIFSILYCMVKISQKLA